MTVTVDSRGFDGMIAELEKRAPNKSREFLMLNQVGKVLETAIKYTPIASLENISKGAEQKARKAQKQFRNGDQMIATGKNGRVWYSEKGGEKPWFLMKGIIGGHTWKFSDQLYNRYLVTDQKRNSAFLKTKKEALVTKKAARGLARQSWVQIAGDLKITVKASPQQVFRAKPSNGKFFDNGTGRIVVTASTVFAHIENRFPALLGLLKGNGILQRAISTRLSAFKLEMKKGILDDVKARARRYPGIFVSS